MTISARSMQPNRSPSPLNNLRVVLLAAAMMLIAGGVSGSHVASASGTPEYSATWLDSGQSFSLQDFRGQVVILNLWATWCEPCKEEMPELESIAREFAGSDLVVIGVSIDRTVDAGVIAQFALDHGASFPIALDRDNAFSQEFRTAGVPETVLIDRNGDIAWHWKGQLEVGSAENREIIAKTLAGTFDSNAAGSNLAAVGYFAAFGAGLLSLLSPCVLPLLPTYAAWMTGTSLGDTRRRKHSMMRNGLLFVLGFSAVFMALGASASMIGDWVHDSRVWIARIGGIVLLVFGLHMLGVFRIGWLDRTAQVNMPQRMQAGTGAGSLVVGIAFGASWTPCIGPILASILTLAASSARPGDGVTLLGVYSLGLAVPFLLSTLFIERFLQHRRRITSWLPVIERVSAVLVIGIGVLMLTGMFDRLAEWAGRFDAWV